MPLKWFICPDGKHVLVSDCLKEGFCRDRCATRSYLQIAARERPLPRPPSTTECIAGTMLAWLRRIRHYAISPGDRAFMILGSKAHAVLEGSDDEYSLLEEKLGGHVTGIFDVFEQESGRSVLVDNKTSGSYKVAKCLGIYTADEPTGEVFKKGEKAGQPKTRKVLKQDPERIDMWDWELQINNYRILLEKQDFKVDEMRILCIVRDGGTWAARRNGILRNTYYFPVRRLPDKEVEGYFRKKADALYFALKYGWKKPCNAQENWNGIRCTRYCEVAMFCPLGKYLVEKKESENMPIKNLSERRRLPRQGKISLGVKKKAQSGKEYPAEVSYFVLRPSTPDENAANALVSQFHELYGEKPTSIKIMFPVGDTESIFPQYYKRYGKGSGLKCIGDGETAKCMSQEYTEGLELVGEEDGLPTVVCNGEECPYQKKKECSKVATLQVLLYEMPGAGVWQITTGSYNSIVNINSDLDYIRAMAGRFHMIPLTLMRVPTDIVHEGKSRTHYPLKIDLNFSLKELMQKAAIDESKVIMSLPGIANEAEDMEFDQTPALPPAEKPEEESKAVGEITYKELLIIIADSLGADLEVFTQFINETLKDIPEARRMVKLKPIADGALGDIGKAYKKWTEKLKEQESAELMTSIQKDTIALLLTKTDMGEIRSANFRNWWMKALGLPKNDKTVVSELTTTQASAIIKALETLVDPKQGELL